MTSTDRITLARLAAFHDELRKGLKKGDIDVNAKNLTSWDERDALAVQSSFATLVRTTAGEDSIDSERGARPVSLVAISDFSAAELRETGFNLLRNAPTVGAGYYMLLPKMEFGSYGTANKVNGLLFTDKDGNNLTPTVRFRPLSQGAPTRVTDGDACTYVDSNGLRFYTTPDVGYVIVSGINPAQVCAHLAWSRRYDEYVAIDSEADTGSTINLSAIITACHDFGLLLVATQNGITVADSITFGDTAATWHRRVGRTQPAWTNTQQESGEWLHEATIADMKAGGVVECGELALTSAGQTVSYTDRNEDATTAYVKYELATVVTGSVAVSPLMKVEDWGVEVLTQATGTAEVTLQYAQNYPDAVAEMVNGGVQRRTAALEAQILALQQAVGGIGAKAEGYIRVAGSSDPALSYKSYKFDETGGFQRDSVFNMLYPCLVGTKLTGDNTQVGKILHVLKKLGARTATAADTSFTEGQAVWDDIYGTPHAIDGSEGDVMITNIDLYYRIKGKFPVQGTEYDVYLVAPTPFTWQGYEAELVTRRGVSPDYCVSHTDTDSVVRMHSVYNPAWDGSYNAPAGVVGKYIYSQDAQTGVITEQYDETATLLGGAGGCSSTGLALYTGEQHAMNHNPDTTKMLPFANQTAASVEDWYALMLAEGGTFDAHKAALMGSGFSSNDPATSAADWEESAAGAKNGIRIYDKEGVPMYYSPSGNAETTIGLTDSADKLFGTIVNSYRTPFKVMEAHRAVSYAVAHGIGELQWFIFEGNKYKYRSVDGFAGPQQGEMTCVVWKMLSTKLGASCFDPTDKTTSIEGHRIDFLFSTALFHGITTQVSPSWWVSGLVFTEDENQAYEAYLQTDPSKLALTPNGEKDVADSWPFEQDYEHAASYASGSGYRKNYARQSLFLAPDNANKSGAGLHTYIGAYNYYSGTAAAAGKKAVRGFRRGYYVYGTALSPLCVGAGAAPSHAYAYIAFGTCVRIVD